METTAVVVNEKERKDARGPKSEETRAWKEGMDPATKERMLNRQNTMAVKQRYFHKKHGEGTVTGVDSDGRTVIEFDIGETHSYAPESLRKLHPCIDDPHERTPEDLFGLCDTDSSGTLELPEFVFL